MPELPEVETVMRGLSPILTGARLTRVEARRPDLRFPLPVDFVQRLTGARVLSLTRRGKYMLAELDRGGALLIHLGMTGRFEIEGASPAGRFALAAPADPKHAHIVFETDADARITFYDARRFGFMDLVDDGDARLAGLGPEPLGPDFDAALLARAFAGRRQSAKILLLDQHIVAGLGNIYVCEALYRARISPTRAAGRLARRRLERLVVAVREVLLEAIEKGGSTLRDFASADGALGYFQHSFEVYDRAGEPCRSPDCHGVIRRIVQGGRSTFYCPACQT
ncbi:MAG TPA: bifunctional DNA-formamidopyrimidine glycosylase/DNA-(apurinic or apyrimidinic site) lyase [Caulobacteraceae bacterium]|jgi:formamidopyrimidine-DNA glycosylase